MRHSLSSGIVVALLVACAGAEGPEGPAGPKGDTGPQGPAGTLAEPPRVAALEPAWGSSRSRIELRGSGFATTAALNRVTFDGVPAVVLEAAANRLLVRPPAAAPGHATVAVTVEVGQQISAPVNFALVHTGHAEPMPWFGRFAPVSAVKLGADLYFGSRVELPGGDTAGGLYRLRGDTLTRLWTSPTVLAAHNGQVVKIAEAPLALATDGTNVFLLVEPFGKVLRFDVAAGDVHEWFAPLSFGDGLRGLAVDGAGNLFLTDQRQGGGAGGVLVFPASGGMKVIADAGAFLHPAAIVLSGTDLLVANDGFVTRIEAPLTSAPVVTPSFITSPNGGARISGRALTLSEDVIVLGTNDARLVSAARSGGVAAPWGDQEGLIYKAESLIPAPSGVYVAQGQGGMVRRALRDGGKEIVAMVPAIPFGVAEIPQGLAIAGNGPAMFGDSDGGPRAGDGALVLATGPDELKLLSPVNFATGLLARDDGTLYFSSCFDGTVSRRAVDGVITTVLQRSTHADIECPAGIAIDGDTLYVANVSPDFEHSSILRKVGSEVDPRFIGPVPSVLLTLLVEGPDLITAAFAPGGTTGEPPSIWRVARTGGTPERIVPAWATGMGGVLARGTEGEIWYARLGDGAIFQLDLVGKDLIAIPRDLLPIGEGSEGGAPSMTFAAAAMRDGAMCLADFSDPQLLIDVAP